VGLPCWEKRLKRQKCRAFKLFRKHPEVVEINSIITC
jgi:hypothetical protein